MKIIGCDPGVFGAVAVIEDGKLITVDDMPRVTISRNGKERNSVDKYALWALFNLIAPADVFFIEQVGGMKGQAAGAAFMFGKNCGYPEMCAAALNIPERSIAPGAWKRSFGLLGKVKKVSIDAACKRFPDKASVFTPSRGNGTTEQCIGRAEAALIGLAGWQIMVSERGGENVNVFG